jgi:hypothetical protein
MLVQMINELAHSLTAIKHDQEFMDSRMHLHQMGTLHSIPFLPLDRIGLDWMGFFISKGMSFDNAGGFLTPNAPAPDGYARRGWDGKPMSCWVSL